MHEFSFDGLLVLGSYELFFKYIFSIILQNKNASPQKNM